MSNLRAPLPSAKVSVVIPTRDRRDSIERLLKSLQASLHPDGVALEVLVVDNASTDDTGKFLREASAGWPALRPMYEGRPGKNFALNRGIQAADGDIVCLMDDDIILDPAWLRQLVNDYRTTGYDALQPRVLPGRDPDGNAAEAGRLYHYNIPVIDYGDSLRDLRGLTGS